LDPRLHARHGQPQVGCGLPVRLAVAIVPTSRVQLALNVTDIDAATRFYTDMFGVGPAKQRTGYANFVVADPPLKLVLFENPGAASPLNHLGVEVASSDDVVAAPSGSRPPG
jgi:catechol 2,3-dioxygenase-like lactoylglutathione lyase family enzyme